MCEYRVIGNSDDKYLNKVLCYLSPHCVMNFLHVFQYSLKIRCSMYVGSVLYLLNQVCFLFH